MTTYGPDAPTTSKTAGASKVQKSAEPVPKKPKKGMATPKQRLGKILKLNKLGKF